MTAPTRQPDLGALDDWDAASARYAEYRRETIYKMRRVLWRHGITTVDLQDGQLYQVVNVAWALVEASGAAINDWGAWDDAMQTARKALGVE